MTAEKATSLRRGLDGLVALSGEEALANGGLGVVRLAELLGSDKSRVSRMLRILQEYELVERDPVTLAYRIGWRIYSLASVVGHARLLEEAPARLDRLMREFDEVTHLSVLSGMRVLQIASRSPDRGLNAGGVVTQAMPAHCTSSGRALLLDHDRRALQERFEGLEWEPARSNAPRDLDDLHARLEQARQFGYVVVIEEWEAGVVGVAAPVRDDRGFIVAAVSLAAPTFRFKRRLATAGRRVKSVAEELSHLIGWPAAALDCPEDPSNSRPRLAEPIAGAAPSGSAMPGGVANWATIAPRPT